MNIFELSNLTEEDLNTLVQKRLFEYPLLKETYDNEFLKWLFKRRSNYNNRLLLRLVDDREISTTWWKEITQDLKVLMNCDAIKHYKPRMRQMQAHDLEVVKTEIEWAAKYKRKGFSVEIHPRLNGQSARPDFIVKFREDTVVFEVKSLFDQKELAQYYRVERDIYAQLRRHPTRFIYTLDLPFNIHARDVSKIKKFVDDTLRNIVVTDSVTFPRSDTLEDKFKLTVWGPSPATKPYGYLGGTSTPVFQVRDVQRMRKRISSAVSTDQLIKGFPNVLVLDCTNAGFADAVDLEDVLFGDFGVSYTPYGQSTIIRTGERIFDPQKNRRISAIIYYNWSSESVTSEKEITVYHNPFADKPLQPDIFREPGITQIVLRHLPSQKVQLNKIE
jgi:hypothetical protein